MLPDVIKAYINTNINYVNELIKLVAKLLPSIKIESGSYFGEVFSNLASTIVDLSQGTNLSSKATLDSRKYIPGILETISSLEPTVLQSENSSGSNNPFKEVRSLAEIATKTFKPFKFANSFHYATACILSTACKRHYISN
jgi:hypothetical protein